MPEHHKNLHKVRPVELGLVEKAPFLVIASDQKPSCRRERGSRTPAGMTTEPPAVASYFGDRRWYGS